jgi:hypothetical protein
VRQSALCDATGTHDAGKDQDRILRAWLVTGATMPAPALLAQHPDLAVIASSGSARDLLPGDPGRCT